MDKRKNISGIRLIAWALIFSNFFLLVARYALPSLEVTVPELAVTLLSIASVFPRDLFDMTFSQLWPAHFAWMSLIGICAFGLLKINKSARMVFIVLDIIHNVVLGYMVVSRYGQHEFLDYFFKLYFNLVAAITYIGFLTIPEVREQFKIGPRPDIVTLLLRKLRVPLPSKINAGNYYNLGLAYSRLERYPDAVQALEKALSVNPHDAHVHFHLGNIYLKQKRIPEAVRAFKETIRIDPFHSEAYTRLGQAYQQGGSHQEAIEAFEKVSKVKYNDPDVYRYLGNAYYSVGRYPEAVRTLSKAVGINPNDEYAFYQMGLIYLTKTEQYPEACEAFRKAVRLNPDVAEFHFHLGLACIRVNRPKDAIRAFKDAVRLDEDDAKAHYQLGFVYTAVNDFLSARKQYAVLKQLDPDLAETLLMLIK
ncbi:MAG: tetratricopeptide repeat protein [Candidatus Omnitrophota bacterium]|nr:tetratricopeptide repeat protein [Candidatus Omnitrophota bacterium]MDZ4242345.1 tetratricopeptide repeat protein [Candidatus Omnitrophota bacterium]